MIFESAFSVIVKTLQGLFPAPVGSRIKVKFSCCAVYTLSRYGSVQPLHSPYIRPIRRNQFILGAGAGKQKLPWNKQELFTFSQDKMFVLKPNNHFLQGKQVL